MHSSNNLNNNNHAIYNLLGNDYFITESTPLSMPIKPLMLPRKCPSDLYKSADAETAINIAANAVAHDTKLRSHHNRNNEESRNNAYYQQQKRSQHNRKLDSALRGSHSPPPIVHQNANRITRNNNNLYQQYQSQSQPQSQLQQSKPISHQQLLADEHYQHYFSYYHNRCGPQTIYRPTRNSSMPAVTQNYSLDAGIPLTELTVGTSFYLDSQSQSPKHRKHTTKTDNNRTEQQHVLKEQLNNNNLIFNTNNLHWQEYKNNANVLNFTRNFFGSEDPDNFDNNMKLPDAKDVQLHAQTNSKCKQELSLGAAENSDSVKKILPLPANTVKAKKPSPPVHRVLHYNLASPRSQRNLSASNRHSEQRRTRKKSPSLAVNYNDAYYKQLAEKNRAEALEYYVSPIKLQGSSLRLGSKNANKHQRIRAGLDYLNRGAGGDQKDLSSSDNDDIDDDDIDDLDNVSDLGEIDDSDLSSDSEEGYRSHAYKLTQMIERVAATDSCLSAQTSEESLQNPESVLVPSLFPNVPPYLSFSSNTKKGPDVPVELHRVLKWKVTNIMPKVVRSILSNSGMRLLKKTNDWMGVWGKHMKSPCFKTVRCYQKINHLPGSFKIGRKDACWVNLRRQMSKHGKKDFGFMPKTYILPNDLPLLRKGWAKYAQRNVKWIIKPPAGARGSGIRVVNRWAQIPKRRPLIVQKYIERPLLINGSKFDLRLYVLVTSVNPLRIYMYHNGLARFASVKYSDKSDTLNDRCMHLTNYSINKFSSNYSKNEDVNACHGHKWTIKSLWTYLANRGIRTDFLWDALRSLVLRTILAGENAINNMIKMNVESKYSCFELFGFDVLLDADLIPWLLEVNISPSLHSELPLDSHVKAPLVQGVLNTALYHVPPKLPFDVQKRIATELSLPTNYICYDKRMYINYLSRAEKIKHNTFTRKAMEDRTEYLDTILDQLTPDDVRCLIVTEDELARSTPLERIFPTNETYKYLKYTENPRYYNRLLDAWEARYGKNRAEGIELLRDLCEVKYHLEVPPSPAKKQLQYRPRTLMKTQHQGMTLKLAAAKIKWRNRRRMYTSMSNYTRKQSTLETILANKITANSD